MVLFLSIHMLLGAENIWDWPVQISIRLFCVTGHGYPNQATTQLLALVKPTVYTQAPCKQSDMSLCYQPLVIDCCIEPL